MTDPAASPHPTAERYLASLDRELAAMPRAERSEVVDEIRAHLHDATAAGQPLGEVLSRLGPAEALAKAYLVESYLNPRPAGLGPLTRTFGLVGLVVFGSFPTLLVSTILGPIGLAFVLSGPLLLASGVCGFFGVSLEPAVQTDLKPWQSVVGGALMSIVGGGCLFALYHYFRWVLKLLRAVVNGH
jgi:uncharacterized membrane protein